MPIKDVTTNYTGRKKDISIMQYPDPTNIDPQDITLSFGRIGSFCAGVQKLIQRYTIILLTNLESQMYYPTFGASLISGLRNESAPTDLIGLTQVFNSANYEAVAIIKSAQVEDRESPDDERILSAELQDTSRFGDAIFFSVKIITESSTAISFVLPLPI